MRKRYRMTQEQLEELYKVCEPVPAIALNCGMPTSPRERANAWWKRLGDEMGFDYMTVKPTRDGDRNFTAEPKEIQDDS